MVRYQVIYDYLNIREGGASTSYPLAGKYYRGDIINSGGEPFKGEDGRLWVSFTGRETLKTLYVCYRDGSTQYLKRI